MQTSSRKGEERKRHDQTVALASMIFTPEDGLVLRDGNTVLLRIYGLEFQPGKSTIEPRFSGLLSKISRAVRMFPNAQITVEGHTETGGKRTPEPENFRIPGGIRRGLSPLRPAADDADTLPGIRQQPRDQRQRDARRTRPESEGSTLSSFPNGRSSTGEPDISFHHPGQAT